MLETPKIRLLLESYAAFVTYTPLRTEVNFVLVTGALREGLVYQIAPRASLDPSTEARNVVEQFKEKSVAIFIPGKRFDASGTRHGQGGGWYDRFLAQVPREWLRIGFCYDDQFSQTPLARQSWDQAMDYVVVVVGRKTNAARVYSSEGI